MIISLLLSNFAMIVSNAVIEDYTVELAFNNIFVFDKWANNSLSTTIVNGGAPVSDKLDIDIENGSFRFTNPYTGEAYTGHGMGTGINAAGNYQYYVMEVEPSADNITGEVYAPWLKVAADLCEDGWLDAIDLTVVINLANYG